MSFKLTDAGCDPHDAKAPAGPIDLRGRKRRQLQGDRDRGARRGNDPRREGEPHRRPLRQLLADPGGRRIHAALQRRRRRRRDADRERQAGGRRTAREVEAGDRQVPRLPGGEHRRAGREDEAVRRRRRRRQRRQGEGAVPGGPHPLRADRAGGRVLRRPRPPHRRPRKRRAEERIRRLPPDRESALGRRHRQGHGPGRRSSCWPTSKNCGRKSRPSTCRRCRSPTAPTSCSARSRPRRSPARRSATRTSTWSTSRPTSKAPRSPSKRSSRC